MVVVYEERPSHSPHIQFVWRATVSESGSFTDIAHDFWVLVFRQQRGHTEVILTGPVTQPEKITYVAGQTNWGIVLKAHVFITGFPKKDMLNNRNRLPLVNDHTFRLGNYELTIPTYETAELFVEQLLQRGVITADAVVARVLGSKPPAMSTRNLQRHHGSATGLTPTQVEQIKRARHAFVLLEQGKSIAEAALEAGYVDQAHMTCSLKILAGRTPGQIVKDYVA